jgi:hypothetical protein
MSNYISTPNLTAYALKQSKIFGLLGLKDTNNSGMIEDNGKEGYKTEYDLDGDGKITTFEARLVIQKDPQIPENVKKAYKLSDDDRARLMSHIKNILPADYNASLNTIERYEQFVDDIRLWGIKCDQISKMDYYTEQFNFMGEMINKIKTSRFSAEEKASLYKKLLNASSLSRPAGSKEYKLVLEQVYVIIKALQSDGQYEDALNTLARYYYRNNLWPKTRNETLTSIMKDVMSKNEFERAVDMGDQCEKLRHRSDILTTNVIKMIAKDLASAFIQPARKKHLFEKLLELISTSKCPKTLKNITDNFVADQIIKSGFDKKDVHYMVRNSRRNPKKNL